MIASRADEREESLTVADYMATVGVSARAAADQLRNAETRAKNLALEYAAMALRDTGRDILAANQSDVDAARTAGRDASFVDRLQLTPTRIDAMARSFRDIAALPDPVGETIAAWDRPNGLDISRVRTPLGVIGIIYESRPNVTADAGALCLKSGNVAILRGGSECMKSNRAIHHCLAEGLRQAGLPLDAVHLISRPDREAVGHMLMGLNGCIDVIIPRGGKSLVARVQSEARVPVFAHLEGICHVYVDRDADRQKALDIVLNAKMRRTGVCGAAETLLVDKKAAVLLAPLVLALLDAGCEVRGDVETQKVDPRVKPATKEDWSTEYLNAIIAVKVVDGVDDAIAHIARHGSSHTESIVTENTKTAEQFLSRVDSAIVMHNASTQFADGGEFGMGAEIGIATGRFHARGPVGLEQLTTFKYVVRGHGQTRP